MIFNYRYSSIHAVVARDIHSHIPMKRDVNVNHTLIVEYVCSIISSHLPKRTLKTQQMVVPPPTLSAPWWQRRTQQPFIISSSGPRVLLNVSVVFSL